MTWCPDCLGYHDPMDDCTEGVEMKEELTDEQLEAVCAGKTQPIVIKRKDRVNKLALSAVATVPDPAPAAGCAGGRCRA